jgi:hypothetical protein|tara:strand:+ start:653 stop:1051 length:399 start_codon:yes stop_codon:yes gene_type:complete
MKDKVEKILSSREWTFTDLTNINKLVRSFSDEIYHDLSSKEMLEVLWNIPVPDPINFEPYKNDSFGKLFQRLVKDQLQIEIASILREKLLTANVNFSNNKNKEEENNDVSEGSLGGKPLKERTADEKKDSEE